MSPLSSVSLPRKHQYLASPPLHTQHRLQHHHHHHPLFPFFSQNGETAPDPLPEERDNINALQQLSMEATLVNQAFREQVLPPDGPRHELAEAAPSELGPAGAGYK